jgi:hypothetical protein
MTASINASLQDPEVLANRSTASKKFWSDPKNVVKVFDPVTRARASETSRLLHKDPNFRKKIAESIKSTELIQSPPKQTEQIIEFIPGRVCCRCREPGSFGKDRNSKDGFKLACKKCEKVARGLTKEKTRIRGIKYREVNREKMRKYQLEHYERNKIRSAYRNKLRRKEINERKANNKEKIRSIVDNIKKSPCHHCGLVKPHVDFYQIGVKRRSIYYCVTHYYNLKRILDEINKCEMLCSDCHKIKCLIKTTG